MFYFFFVFVGGETTSASRSTRENNVHIVLTRGEEGGGKVGDGWKEVDVGVATD